jgi:hypothetical protein
MFWFGSESALWSGTCIVRSLYGFCENRGNEVLTIGTGPLGADGRCITDENNGPNRAKPWNPCVDETEEPNYGTLAYFIIRYRLGNMPVRCNGRQQIYEHKKYKSIFLQIVSMFACSLAFQLYMPQYNFSISYT